MPKYATGSGARSRQAGNLELTQILQILAKKQQGDKNCAQSTFRVKEPAMSSPDSASATRRTFLHQAAGIAAGLAAASSAEATDSQPTTLPAIKLGPHAVTRLVLGGNPIYGHSHFNKLL